MRRRLLIAGAAAAIAAAALSLGGAFRGGSVQAAAPVAPTRIADGVGLAGSGPGTDAAARTIKDASLADWTSFEFWRRLVKDMMYR